MSTTAPRTLPADSRVRRIVERFERLQPADLPGLDTLYTPDAHFKDPFNDVRGLPAVQAVFAHMFASLGSPHFEILDGATEGDRCFLTWDFHYRWRGRAMHIHGGSWLQLAPDGRIADHRDYWDAAEELYEKLPLLGRLLRWLRRRAAA